MNQIYRPSLFFGLMTVAAIVLSTPASAVLAQTKAVQDSSLLDVISTPLNDSPDTEQTPADTTPSAEESVVPTEPVRVPEPVIRVDPIAPLLPETRVQPPATTPQSEDITVITRNTTNARQSKTNRTQSINPRSTNTVRSALVQTQQTQAVFASTLSNSSNGQVRATTNDFSAISGVPVNYATSPILSEEQSGYVFVGATSALMVGALLMFIATLPEGTRVISLITGNRINA